MNVNNIYQAADCPFCGKKEGAVMMVSGWRHNLLCCSLECGSRASDQIELNEATEEYQRALLAAERAQIRADKIRMKNVFIKRL